MRLVFGLVWKRRLELPLAPPWALGLPAAVGAPVPSSPGQDGALPHGIQPGELVLPPWPEEFRLKREQRVV